jgi:hypothetical protein
MSKRNTSNFETETSKAKRDTIRNAAGGITLDRRDEVSQSDPETTYNNSRVEIGDSSGNFISLLAGGLVSGSVGGRSETTSGNKTESTGGRVQKVVGGDNREYTKGNEIKIVGKQLQEDIRDAQRLQRGVEEIEREKVNKIKSTKGEMVPCPTCETEYLKKNKSRQSLFELLRRIKIPYFGFAIDVLQFLYNLVIGNALRVFTGRQLLGGTCGNKGCKDGMVESPQRKLEDGNNAAVQKATEMFEDLNQPASRLKCGSSAQLYSGDVTIRAGLVDNAAPSHADSETWHNYEYQHKKDIVDGSNFVKSGEGNAKRIVATSPHPTVGNITFSAANKIVLQSGSPGLDIITKGHSDLQFGSVTIASGEGETVLCSNNLTTLKGKNIKIDADDRSGAGGILLKSNHTMCAGALHVNGNSTMMGSLAIDGNLCAPFLVTESMRMQTDDSGPTKTIVNGAMWAGTSQALTFADRFLQLIMRDVMPGYVMTAQGIFTIALEAFNALDISTIIEPIPTGVYLGACVNAAGPGASWGLVWNFKHCHMQTPQNHTHDYTAPKGQYLNNKEAWGNARTDGSHIPTPATAEGDGTSPGPKSSGGCGGGGTAGFGFGTPNSSASQNRINRNARYGIIGSDAYGNYDFVNSLPSNLNNYGLTGFNIGDFTYDDDGNIRPEIDYSIGLECPSDVDNLLVDPNSPKVDC